ncbi:MAG: tetratricopeptide repeat protein [Kofleriaceae bacterium]
MGRSVALLACLAVSTPAPLLAQPSPPDASPGSPGDAAYAEGRRFYDLGEWDEAIERFKEAYQLRADPASLFNIAQAYRLKGDCVEAQRFYKTYRRNFPAQSNIPRVERFISELEPCVQQRRAAAAAEPAAPAPTPAPAPVVRAIAPPPPPPARGRGLRVAGTIIGISGLAIAAGGLGFGLRARAIQGEIEDSPVWAPSLDDRGRRYDALAQGMLIGGGALLVAGGVLGYLGWRQGERSQVTVVPQDGGGAVVWTGAF